MLQQPQKQMPNVGRVDGKEKKSKAEKWNENTQFFEREKPQNQKKKKNVTLSDLMFN